ncbi:cob(I)yrinic acid a,c-diamide adenosyltransferase [Frisingicoccus sp.]|uniref:cob(I)yrinic acid a,c-diamide adenosyltransferase n=1 Tax=Frisingicoccus sp. TaxID=1918627 RepID=UPI003AB15726
MIHIYCGSGKGKTTAGMGLCLRAAGAGKKVLIYQFLKDNTSSERILLEQVKGITLLKGPDRMRFLKHMTPEEKQELEAAYEQVILNIGSLLSQAPSADVIFLDEVLYGICRGVISEDTVAALIGAWPEKEWILTGRYEGGRLWRMADYISEIHKEKHPYDRGVAARKGIEC